MVRRRKVRDWSTHRVLVAVMFLYSIALTTNPSAHAHASNGGPVVLTSTDFEVGKAAVVTTTGDSNAFYRLLFDTVPGDFTLPGGAWFGLGLSPSFNILDAGNMDATGVRVWATSVPSDPTLVGIPFYLQAVQEDAVTGFFDSSNRLDLVVRDGNGTSVTATVPIEGVGLEVLDPVEVWTSDTLRDATVNTTTVKLRDSSGQALPANVSLTEGANGAVIRIEPTQPLARGDTVEVFLNPYVKDSAGNPLVGQTSFLFPVVERQHPVLINNTTEMDLYIDRINQGQSPWKPAWDYLKKEVDKFAMPASPNPHSGKPPSSQSAFNAMYYDWFTDSRYALDCAMAWHVTGQSNYASKARSFLTAWFVFDPDVVGQWWWSIQFDIAGLNYLLAADYLWNYSGLTASDRGNIRALLDDLADTVQRYQMDDSDTNPNNIRSWNNALLVGVGYFLDRPDLVQWAIEPNQGNPFHFYKMFDDAMAPDGEMWDTQRGNSTPYQGITYPAYHLHAWSVLSEFSLHHGVDLYRAQNQDGNTQLKGWQWLYPYMDGSISVSGLTPQIIEDFCIAKMYLIQRIERQSTIENLFNEYNGEPLFETHITKKAASWSHNMPASLVGPDSTPPPSVINARATAIGATTVFLDWDEGLVNHEGDLAYRYEIYRNGTKIGTTGARRFVDTTAITGTSYNYWIQAKDFSNNTASGTQVSVTTLAIP